MIGSLFSFGDITYKLTESDWARSGVLGLVFLNEMFLESWVQIVLQIINNSEYVNDEGERVGNWGGTAIPALVASLLLFVVNAIQFTVKASQNKTFGLAGAFLSAIKHEDLGEWETNNSSTDAPKSMQAAMGNTFANMPEAPRNNLDDGETEFGGFGDGNDELPPIPTAEEAFDGFDSSSDEGDPNPGGYLDVTGANELV